MADGSAQADPLAEDHSGWDVIIQTSDVHIAHRIWRYAVDKRLRVFPEALRCRHAQELGLAKGWKDNACLLLLQGMHCSRMQLVKFLEESFLGRYVMRLYWVDAIRPGNIDDVRARLRAGLLDQGQGPFRLQCFPRKIESGLSEHIPDDVVLDPREYRTVYSMVLVEETIYESISDREVHFRNKPDNATMSKGNVASAVKKLQEAVLILGLELDRGMRVIDVGAAPGAWTALCAQKVQEVVAIDPAGLDSEVLNLDNVTYIQKKIEDAVPQLLLEDKLFDLITCDINKHPKAAAPMLLRLMPLLRPGGRLVFTVKFFGRNYRADLVAGYGQGKEEVVQEVVNQLGDLVEDVQCVWLLSNTVFERTLIASRSNSRHEDCNRAVEAALP